MTIGIEAANTDLDSLFALYINGTKAANTGIQYGGVDIASRYQALATGNGTQRANVGMQHAGTDLAAIFSQFGSASAPSPAPSPLCVREDMMLAPNLKAGDAQGGDWFDGVGFTPKYHLIPQEIMYTSHHKSECIRIKSESGAEIVISITTPMPQRTQEGRLISEMGVGDEVFVCDNGRYRWEPITEYENVGEHIVVFIHTEVQCYLAGVDPNLRIASHIPDTLYAMEEPGPEYVARPMLKPTP